MFNYEIECNNCGHKFYYANKEAIEIDDPFTVTGKTLVDACPSCHQWLLSYKTYYTDGQIMSQVSGGSGAAFYPIWDKWGSLE